MSNAGKNLEQKLEYPKYAVGFYLMVPEVQETQIQFDFVLFNRIPHAFSVYCQSDGVIGTHSLALK